MKGLRIIPWVLVFSGLAYLGVLFIQLNSQAVTIDFGWFETPDAPVGFMVISSFFIGLCFMGVFVVVEHSVLVYNNKALRRKIKQLEGSTSEKKASTGLTKKEDTKLSKPASGNDFEREPEPIGGFGARRFTSLKKKDTKNDFDDTDD